MTRYRVARYDFDARVRMLTGPIHDHWEEQTKEIHRQNKARIEEGLREQYGLWQFEPKLKNFIDLGAKPFSIVAFHNKFFEQCRVSFVMGGYYPALTGACALGERVLNHLMLALREDFKGTPEYKRVYRKDSFDDWKLAIDTLTSWDVFLPATTESFLKLKDLRHRVIHFKPDTDHDDRPLALEALSLFGQIVSSQFAALGKHPWFLTGVPGEVYIRKEAETWPFVRRVYLPNCCLVGPYHTVEDWTLALKDEHPYEDREITDEEFCRLRTESRPK
jgi:hypothetical protein